VEAWFNLGEVLEKLDRLDDAIFAYERVISLMPDLAPAYGNLGCVLTETGRLDEAIQVLKRSIAIEPAFPPTHTNLGNAYKYAGDMDQLIAAHQEAIRLAPGYADARYNLGVTLSMAGQYESAVEMLSSAIELRPELSRAKVALGAAYIGLKEPDYALALCLESPPEDCEMLALKPFALASSGRAGEAEAFADYGRFAGDRMLAAPPGYTDLDEFNNALVGHILAHPSLAHAPTSHATVNGKHTGNLLTEPIGPFADFEAALWAAVDTYQSEIGEGDEHPFGNRRELGELVVWAIVMENGGHQVPHFYPTGWISGVYYPRLPDFHDGLGGSDAGWLEFGAPPPDIPFSGQTHIRKVEPKEGLLLFFPSFFYHRTIPFNAAEPRVSIAFDFRPAL
ncbi:MAG: tetratricopeptide repeat protein, partial [Proteobacteria bacterium]|nr:tetratricopeptide repeat protein [Pseudomonadota bacterium]